MKNLILFCIVLFAYSSVDAQTLRGQRILLDHMLIDSFSLDGTFSSPSDTKIASTQAIWDFMQNNVNTTVSDTDDIDLTLTGSDITATAKLDISANNVLTKSIAGLLVDETALTITESQISDLVHTVNTDTQLTEEQVHDFVGNLITGNIETLITVTYDDGGNAIDFVVENDLSLYDNSTSGFLAVEVDGSTTNELNTSVTMTAGAINVIDAGGTKSTPLISTDVGNTLVTGADGKLFSAAGAGESTTVSSTDDVDLTLIGSTISATTKLDVSGDNVLTKSAAGLLVDKTNITITESQISDLAHTTDTDTQLTEEEVEDFSGSLLNTGTETLIDVTYQDGTNDIDFVVNDDLSLYDNTLSGFLTSEVDGSITNEIELPPGGIAGQFLETTDGLGTYNWVDPPNDDQQDLILKADSLGISNGESVAYSDLITELNEEGGLTDNNTQLSEEQVEDFVGSMVTTGTKTLISVLYQDGTNDLDFIVENDLSLYDNSASGFISSEVDGSTTNELNTSVTLVAGTLGVVDAGGTKGTSLISTDAGNTINAGTDGKLYSAAGAGESTTVSDTDDVDLTLSGSNISATTKLDVSANNVLTKSVAGLLVDKTALTITESQISDLHTPLWLTNGTDVWRTPGSVALGMGVSTLGRFVLRQASDAQTGGLTILRADGGNGAYMYNVGDAFHINTSPGNGKLILAENINQKVAIGLAAPQAKLHQEATDGATNGNYHHFTTEFTGSLITDGFSLGIAPNGMATFVQRENDDMRFLVNGTDRLHILSNGNVGVGTAIPESLLHLEKTLATATTNEALLTLKADYAGATTNGSFGGYISFHYRTGGNQFQETAGIGIVGESANNADLVFSLRDGAGNPLTERLRIDATGGNILDNADFLFTQGTALRNGTFSSINLSDFNDDIGLTPHWATNANGIDLVTNTDDVGVGLDLPLAKLHIKSDGSDAFIVENSSATDIFHVQDNGAIGVSIATPNTKLHLHEPSASFTNYIQLTNNISGTGAADGLRLGVLADASAAILQGENKPMYFSTNNLFRMTLAADGDLKLNEYDSGRLTDGEPVSFTGFDNSGNFQRHTIAEAIEAINTESGNLTPIQGWWYNSTTENIHRNDGVMVIGTSTLPDAGVELAVNGNITTYGSGNGYEVYDGVSSSEVLANDGGVNDVVIGGTNWDNLTIEANEQIKLKGGQNVKVVTNIASTTITNVGYIQQFTTATADQTCTLPLSPESGDIYVIVNIGPNSCFIAPNTGKNLNGGVGSIELSTPYSQRTVYYDGLEWVAY